jgi:uncharacterized protein (DUF58 family)
MRRDIARTSAIVLVVPLVILVIALFGDHILVWRLFSLSVLVLLLSFLWSRLQPRGLDGQINNSPEHCQVGDSFFEDITINSSSVLPKVLIKIWQNTDLPGHDNRVALNLASRGSYRWQTEVKCQNRGRYHIGPLALETTDPFGIFQVQRLLGKTSDLLIYPATPELTYRPVISRGSYVFTRNAWLAGGRRGLVARVREYAPGDSLSHIHWHSTAHTGQLMVKDYNTDLSKNTWLVLNMAGCSPAGSEHFIEQCVTITASLAKKFLDANHPVGLMVQGQDFNLLPLGVGEAHYWDLMEVMALAKIGGNVPVDRLIEQERKHVGSDSLVIVVTPVVTDDLVVRLLRLSNQGITTALILPDGLKPEAISKRLTVSGLPAYYAQKTETQARTTQDLPFFMPSEN